VRKGISISPRTAEARPSVEELVQLGVENVRFVFQSHAVKESTEQALGFYTPLVEQFNARSIRAILVINQESHPSAPWINGQWDEYHREMAALCRAIAQHFASRRAQVGYVVWNEGDIHGESSVYYPAEQYGKLLRACFDAIRSVDRTSLIYTQGHANSAPLSLRYFQTALRAAGGSFPGLIFNRHPYGQYVGSQPPNIPTGWFGRLNDDLRTFNVLDMPIAIGEIGVSEPHGFPAWSYRAIADYMRDVYRVCAEFRCTDFIWFGYHDVMRGAGIRDFNNRPKEHIYAMFQSLNAQTQPQPETGWQAATNVNLRQLPDISSRVLAVFRAGEPFELNSSVECQPCAVNKVGDRSKWIAARCRGIEGFVNAAFVRFVEG
jgi:hypothetical protein